MGRRKEAGGDDDSSTSSQRIDTDEEEGGGEQQERGSQGGAPGSIWPASSAKPFRLKAMRWQKLSYILVRIRRAHVNGRKYVGNVLVPEYWYRYLSGFGFRQCSNYGSAKVRNCSVSDINM
jgi:hypothetical protein